MLREISKSIVSAGFFSLMADECIDCSNREQFTINICWVDANLEDNVAFTVCMQWMLLMRTA